MRNQYAGKCYKCNAEVGIGEGHFERRYGKWKTHCIPCVIKGRALKAEKEEALRLKIKEARQHIQELIAITLKKEGISKIELLSVIGWEMQKKYGGDLDEIRDIDEARKIYGIILEIKKGV